MANRMHTRSQGPPDEDSLPPFPDQQGESLHQRQGRRVRQDTFGTAPPPRLESLARTEERGDPSAADRFDPNDKTKDELIQYMERKMRECQDLFDHELWQVLNDDFYGWNIDHFRKIPTLLLVRFRKMLRTNGIYSSLKDPPANALHATFTEPLGPDWNEARVKEYLTYQGTDISLRLKHNFGYLLTNEASPPQKQERTVQLPPVQDTKPESSTPQRSPKPETVVQPSIAPTTTSSAPPTTLSHSDNLNDITLPASRYTTPPAFTNPYQGGPTAPFPDDERRTTTSIVQLTKMYTDDLKYTGSEDAFDYKYQIFLDLCQRAGVPMTVSARRLAFPTMLKGAALAQYYSTRNYWDTRGIEPHVGLKERFEGIEQQRSKQAEWSLVTLQRICGHPSNEGKSVSACLEIMLQKLQLLYHSLPNDLRNDTVYHLKILEATRLHPDCDWATAKPSMSIPGLIQDLRSCVSQHEERRKHTTHHMAESESYYTDRRYHDRTPNRGSNRQRPHPSDKKCYVCEKIGCYSTRHTKEEREKAKQRFRERMNKRVNHYFAEQDDIEDEAKDDNNDDNTTHDPAEALIAEEAEKSTTHTMFAEVYLSDTTSDSLEKGRAISQELAERSALHYITTTLAPMESNDVIGQLILPPACGEILTNQKLPYEDRIVEPQLAPHSIFMSERYSSNTFHGLLLDTGAGDFSSAGYDQFLAYQKVNKDAVLDTSTKGSVSVKFGVGEGVYSLGSCNVKTPVGTVQFHIMPTKTPFLLSLKDLDCLNVYFDNTRNALIGPEKGQTTPVVRRFGHPFLLTNETYETYLAESLDANPCYLTEGELRRLHRRFGHPSTERLHRVLERSGHDVDIEAMEHIRKFCHHCQTHGKSPGRFRFTLHDDKHFNHSLIVDIMKLDGKDTLHAIDEATRFQTARFLPDMKTRTVWDTLRAMWIDTYLGPPDFIITDSGTNFASKEFSQHASSVGTLVKTVPVEAHWSIGMIERYHAVLRRTYDIVHAELPTMQNTHKLQMAIKAINDTAGPDGYVPTLLVFGAHPRLVEYDPPAPSVAQRAAVLKKAIDEVSRLYTKRQVNDALNTRNGPSSLAVLNLPINSEVLIWREGNNNRGGRWTGPYKLLATEGETCTVAVGRKPTQFRSTVVKPYHREDLVDDAELQVSYEDDEQSQDLDDSGLSANKVVKLPVPTVVIPAEELESFLYEGSQEKEYSGLLEREVFEVVPGDEVPKDVRIFGTRFVNEVKNKGTVEAYEKSRLVVQAYNDPGKGLVLRASPTIQRSSQRALVAIVAHAALHLGAKLYLRDVTQAYVQSGTKLNRDFYVRPPPELKDRFAEGSVWKVIKPLYGIPEAGNHWFEAYHAHHREKLNMEPTTYDPCLLHTKGDSDSFGVVGLQTDDTLILADDKFAEYEERAIREAKIDCKPRQQLSPSTPLKFNGGIISEDSQGITLTQPRSLKQIQLVKDHNADTVSSRGKVRKDLTPYEQYISQRALGAYIASLSQPEAAYDLSQAAQTTTPTKEDINTLNKRLKWQKENDNRGLRFVEIDMPTAKLMAFADAGFAGNRDYSSQIGYVLVLTDAKGNANILHWSSTKCKRITRSVLAAELYAFASAFDAASAIRDTLMQILHLTEQLPLVVCTDSKSIYDCLVKLGTTAEKRLMIDLMCLRQAFERQEINEVKWIDGNTNPADAMTKAKPCSALKELIDTNKLQLRVEGWTEHTTSSKA